MYQNGGRQQQLEFKVVQQMAMISEWVNESKGIHNFKELNKVSWNNRQPVVDIRNWFLDEQGQKRPGKGISFNDNEARDLCAQLIAAGYGPQQ